MANQKGAHRQIGSGDIDITKDAEPKLTTVELRSVTDWVQGLGLKSRPLQNLSRDFSNGVLFAELINRFYPKLVEMHNYARSSSLILKKSNWEVLNKKVLSKLGLQISPHQVLELSQSQPEKIEILLNRLRTKWMFENEKISTIEDRNGDKILDWDPIRVYEDACIISKKPEGVEVIYKGIKMIPASINSEKDKQIDELEKTLKDLGNKAGRQATLILLKDERIEELSSHLNEIRIQQNETI